jgi:hypothetical protein
MARHGYMVQDSDGGGDWYNLFSCDTLDAAIAEAADVENEKRFGKNWERYLTRVKELPSNEIVWKSDNA